MYKRQVYDTADALLPATREHAEQIAHAIAASSGIEVVVYTQQAATAPGTTTVSNATSTRAIRTARIAGKDGRSGITQAPTSTVRASGRPL